MKLLKHLITLLLLCACINANAQYKTKLPEVGLYVIDNSNSPVVTTSSFSFEGVPSVVITYSDEWCNPCVNIIDELNEDYTKMAPSGGLKVYSINIDNAVDKYEYAHSSWDNIVKLKEKDSKFSEAIRTIKRAPRIFFLDAEGYVVYAHENFNITSQQIYGLADLIGRKKVKAGELYFNKDWFPCAKETASYFRKVNKLATGKLDVKDCYMNGSTQMSGQYEMEFPAYRTGEFRYYDSSNRVTSKGRYEKNLLEGGWSYWDNKGILNKTAIYVNGKLDGDWKVYHDNGNVYNAGVYKNGNPEGAWMHYYADGKKYMETFWKNGKRNGLATGWHNDGKIFCKVNWLNNEILFEPSTQMLYNTGKPFVTVANISADKKIADIFYYWPNGTVMRTISRNAANSLLCKTYYEDGVKKSEYTLVGPNNLVEGDYTEWDSSGAKIIKLNIYNGSLNGGSTVWFPSGKIKESYGLNSSVELSDEKGIKLQANMNNSLLFMLLTKPEDFGNKNKFDGIKYFSKILFDEEVMWIKKIIIDAN